MKRFVKIVDDFYPLSSLENHSILDVLQGLE